MKQLFRLILALMLILSLVACGQDVPSSTPSGSSSQGPSVSQSVGTRPTTDRAENPIILPEEVKVIVSLAPASTQVLCDLGLADRIAAVDTNSPAYAPDLGENVLQFDILDPDLEQLIALSPDLILVSNISSQGGDDIFRPLRDAGICVAEIPTSNTLADVMLDVQFIADCAGASEAGQGLVSAMQADLDAVSAIGKTITEPKTVLFEISPLPYLYSFGSGVYLDEMLTLIGAKNVLGDQEGWVPVTEESAVAANPDVILTSDNFSGGDPVAEILARPGWEHVAAVETQQVYYIDNGASSLPNHHVAQALKEMARAIYPEAYASLK